MLIVDDRLAVRIKKAPMDMRAAAGAAGIRQRREAHTMSQTKRNRLRELTGNDSGVGATQTDRRCAGYFKLPRPEFRQKRIWNDTSLAHRCEQCFAKRRL